MLNILNKIFDNPKSIKSRFGRLLNKLNIKKIFVAIESFSSGPRDKICWWLCKKNS